MQLTDQLLQTQRLRASRMVPAHLPHVRTVLAENLNVLLLLWESVDIDVEAQAMVNHTDVPPDGLSEDNRNYLLQTHDGHLVGVLCSCLYFQRVSLPILAVCFCARSTSDGV